MICSRLTAFLFLYFCLTLQLSYSQYDKNYFLVDSIDPATLQSGDKAILDSILPLYHKAKKDTERLNLLGHIVEECYDDNVWPRYNQLMYDIAQNGLKNSSSLSAEEKTLVRGKLADALNNMGFLNINRGDVNKALAYFNRSLKINKELGSVQGMASALTNIGYIYKSQGNIEKALDHYDESLKCFEKTGDKQGIANCLNNIGLIYKNQGEAPKALEYYEKSMSIMRELGDKQGVAACLNNIGYIYANKNEHAKALENYLLSLKLDEENQDKQNIANSLNNIGTAYEKLNDLTKALDYYFKSLAIYKEIENKKGVSEAAGNIAETYFKQDKINEAMQYGLQSYSLANELGYPLHIGNSAELLSKIYERKNKMRESLNMYRIYVRMRDSIFNEQTQNSTIKQQMKYEYEKQEVLKEAEHQKQMELSRAEKKRQSLLNLIYGGGFISFFAISGFMFSRYKVTRRQNRIIEKQKQEVGLAYDQLSAKNKEVVDSIRYAKRIQSALLKPEEHVNDQLPEHFVLFKPKDIVSGDFYWSYERENFWYVAAADCTGHGVPGAFLTMLGTAFLNEIVSSSRVLSPAEILNHLRDKMVNELSKTNKNDLTFHESLLKDGMDISLVRYNLITKGIQWAGANTPLWIGRKANEENTEELKTVFNKTLDEFSFAQIKADKQPIGYYPNPVPFTNHEITLKTDDIIYLFTDGYADQFGGPKGKKFKYTQLEQLLASISKLSMKEQKQVLSNTLKEWKGNLEQIDDITLIAIKV